MCVCYRISCICLFFFFKQKTAYEMRISDWSSDVCSSDLGSKGSGIGGATLEGPALERLPVLIAADPAHQVIEVGFPCGVFHGGIEEPTAEDGLAAGIGLGGSGGGAGFYCLQPGLGLPDLATGGLGRLWRRSDGHPTELHD